MKKMISLLAVALVATTFAAGCGKLEHCKDASKSECTVADKFEKDKGDKGNCEWVDFPGSNKGGCFEKAAASTEKTCLALKGDACKANAECEEKDGLCHAKRKKNA
ncbi:MAG TPA: hypothetical protein VEL47_01995 [Myxococcota bacterium]|nr:hypothetical protein [Myxococcota bacterium]